MNQPLLAKSSISGKPPKTLVGHTGDVTAAVKFLYGTENHPTRLAQEWLRFFRLAREDYNRFLANTLAAAAFHDPGKANDGFQKVVTHKGDQSIRHEHLSGLLLSFPEFQAWLQHNPLLDFDIVLASVISHHLKVNDGRWGQPQGLAKTFRVLADTPDFTTLLDTIGSILQLPIPFRPKIHPHWSFEPVPNAFCLSDLLEEAKLRARRFERDIKSNLQRLALLLAVKAALLAADSAGSGVVRVGHNLETWIKAAFGSLLTAGDIYTKVIIPRTRDVQKKTHKRFLFQDFQRQAAKLNQRALMLAPCGSGKTLAAWCWIAARLKDKPTARVLFLYPTRATATEGFRDYVSWAPAEDAALAHGTAAYDLEEMFENPADSRTEKDFTAEDRLYALGLWPKRLFSATADQFLAFMQNQYGPLCLLPLLVDSVVVVDEVHSFDKQMFSALVKFLKRFDVPVLCMTASLITSRRDTLVKECGLQLFPNGSQELDDLRTKAEHPRYRLQKVSPEDAKRIAKQAFAAKQKVLWVVNQVRRCQDLAIALGKEIGEANVLCYHSRFKLEHRRAQHKAVVDAFQTKPGPLLAVTTQVCEMSLDLDADVLITEEAPISSLIQRMGRCNRHSQPGDKKVGEVFVYSAQDSKPYLPDELSLARKFVAALDGKRFSQADLEAALEQYQAPGREPERFSSFLDSGSYAMSYPYREGNDFTVPAVLDIEIDTWLEMKKTSKPTDGFIVPVPKRFARSHTALGRFLSAAPTTHYDKSFGFLEHPVTMEK
jgi:CRISPR-associated endonuclease/helicase Cas3